MRRMRKRIRKVVRIYEGPLELESNLDSGGNAKRKVTILFHSLM
jgi:hypothetical protein